ncbi:sugar transferase [Dasania marina]|uniref:sugar transferase n=1 Tax=Dasania marina TaxID=471499 RepID=UPI00035ED1E4|nr:sugar transferase [Dasania marina]
MLKRLFDFICSIVGLTLLSPILLIIALWVKLDSPGPIFFKQERIGRYGVRFNIYKFRSMIMCADKKGLLTVGSDPRITNCGRFIRKLKIDELPQLVNVLFGSMSLVGPRPEVEEYINFYPDEVKAIILSVRPGITDKASIEMIDENEILAGEKNPKKTYVDVILPIKQQYYLEYVKRHSLAYDVALIFKTLARIFSRKA